MLHFPLFLFLELPLSYKFWSNLSKQFFDSHFTISNFSASRSRKTVPKGKLQLKIWLNSSNHSSRKYGHLNGIDLICRYISNSTWYALQLISEGKRGEKNKRLTVIYVIYILQSFRMSRSLESVWEVQSCVPNKDILLTIAAKTEKGKMNKWKKTNQQNCYKHIGTENTWDNSELTFDRDRWTPVYATQWCRKMQKSEHTCNHDSFCVTTN